MISWNEQAPQLLTMDYDGTTHLTSESGPGICNVDDAYRLAIEEELGEIAAHAYYQVGHQHRTPAEIVLSLAPDLDPGKHKKVTRNVVAGKLEILTDQIGTRLPDGVPWPRLTDGFAEFWKEISGAKSEGAPIGTAIVSAGHTSFQQKTFELWDLPHPDMYLTDDVVANMALKIPVEQQAKPSPMLIRLAETLWIYQLQRRHHPSLQIFDGGLRIVHIGDSKEKDGGAAVNAGADFVWLKAETAKSDWARTAKLLNIGNYAVLGAHIDG